MALPFRLYGALLGAQLSHAPILVEAAALIFDRISEEEAALPLGARPHSGINKAALAIALDPLALDHWPGEQVFRLQ